MLSCELMMQKIKLTGGRKGEVKKTQNWKGPSGSQVVKLKKEGKHQTKKQSIVKKIWQCKKETIVLKKKSSNL